MKYRKSSTETNICIIIEKHVCERESERVRKERVYREEKGKEGLLLSRERGVNVIDLVLLDW